MVKLASLAVVLWGGTAAAQQPPPRTGVPTIPYRGTQGTPRPQANTPAPAFRPMTPIPATAGTGGRVLYYQKPADALTATGSDDTRDVAQVSGSTPPALPDFPPAPPAFIPPPNRAVEIPPLTQPSPSPRQAPIGFPQPGDQPGTSTSQKQPPPGMPSADAAPKIPIPSPAAIFIMYDDRALEAAVVQSLRIENPKLELTTRFPELPAMVRPGTTYVPKTARYEPRTSFYEPQYVVHRRLHFEEKNSERYGWDLGIIQPFVSTAVFYKDTLLWPQSLMTGVFRGTWDTNAGKCLPGSPTPYYLYPPGLTMGGSLFEAGVITGLFFIIP